MLALCLLTAFSLKAQYSEKDLLSEANALFEKHSYAEAMPLYAQLLSLHSTSPEYNYKYGATALYGDADKKEEAIKYLKYASSKAGIDVKCWYFLGRAYHLNYQFADAIKAYEKFMASADKKEVAALNIDREIEDCRNGQNLLSNIKEVTVLNKIRTDASAFFRIYDLSKIGGKILVTPDALLSNLDKKLNHRSLIHYRGTGTTVYFSSYGKDGKNGLDIYRATVLPDGQFSTPEALGPEINTPYDEDYPYLHPDEKSFYFSSRGHSSMGGYDIFRSAFDPATGKFSPAVNMDFAINTPDDDLFYVVDSARQVANFASSRRSRQGELDVYTVLVKSAPAEFTLVKGTFSNDIVPGNRLAKITIIETSTNARVDVQFTDPQSGDYVLSFPRGGRYKLAVEIQDSKQVHTGMVNIPSGSGISAYMQEMNLVNNAGVEKLVINNLFDQEYQGDITALAQRMLRQRAALDVNFNAAAEPAPEPLPEVSNAGPDFEKAYSAAGFGAGFSNAEVLAMAEKRSADLEQKAARINALQAAAAEKYVQELSEAEERIAETRQLLEKAAKTSGDERSRLMFEAGIAKMKATYAQQEAENALILSEKLAGNYTRAREKFSENRRHTESLETALKSGDYTQAVAALTSEKQRQEEIDKTSQEGDPLKIMQDESLAAREEAKNYLDRATSLRKQTEDLQARRRTKERQLETAKGKDRQTLSAELTAIESDLEGADRRTRNAFEKADQLQDDANSKRMQYEMLASLNSKVKVETKATLPEKVTPPATTKSEEIQNEIAGLDIDPEAVKTYLASNPDAPGALTDPSLQLAFRKAYATQTSESPIEETGTVDTEELAEPYQPQPATSAPAPANSGSSEIGPDTLAENINDTGAAGSELNTEEQVSTAIDPSFSGDTSHTTDRTDGKEGQPAVATTDETESTGNAVVSEQVLAAVLADTLPAPDAGVTADRTESSHSDHEAYTDNTNAGDRPKANSGKAESGKMSEQIAKKNADIAAADDWMAIIRASVADLESEAKANGTINDPEVQEQLKQYRALIDSKQKEKEASLAEIHRLEAAQPSASVNTELAVQKAEADMDTLSNALISRIEMKSNESATDIQTVRDVRTVQRDYQSELTAIELAGLSDPELAEKRIRLNKQFISEIESKLRDPEFKDLSEERLLELRRMKTLELKNDRKVLAGEMEFQPLTPEARQYQDMIADKPAVEEVVPEKSGNLSPELEKDLQTPFTRDMVLASYADRKDANAQLSDSARLAQNIALNEEYLLNLRSELAMVQAAAEDPGNKKDAVLMDRYNTLLSDRSAAVEELESDRRSLQAIAIADTEIAETGEEVTISDQAEDPTSESADTTKILSSAAIIHDLETRYTEEYTEIAKSGESDAEKIRDQAALNTTYALKIDRQVEELMAELDNPMTLYNRDSLQIAVQQLDAIAADKRQEADRLTSKADLLAAEMVVVEDSGNTSAAVNGGDPDNTSESVHTSTVSSQSEKLAQVSTSVTKAEMAAKPDSIAKMTYKSLNANISYNSIRESLDSNALDRQVVEQFISEIEASNDVAEKVKLSTQLDSVRIKIENRNAVIQEVIANSNAAEIAYFQNDNQQMIARIEKLSTLEKQNIPLTEYAERSSQLNQRYTEIETAYTKGEITREQKMVSNQELLQALAALNTSLDRVRDEYFAAEPIAAADSRGVDTGVETAKPELAVAFENPENYEPMPGYTYLSPILANVRSELSDSQVRDIRENSPELHPLPASITEINASSDTEILRKQLDLPGSELSKIEKSPAKTAYLAASLRADTLKKLEQQQAQFAKQATASGKEQLSEIERLRSALKHEDNTNSRELLSKRIERLEASMIRSFGQASLAAAGAEELRKVRLGEEERLATSAQQLRAAEIASLSDLLKTKTYTVIPSDLASADMSDPAKPAQPQNKAPQDTGITRVEKIEESVTENTKAPSTPTVTADEDLASARGYAPVSVNTNVNSIDEEILLKANGGNWLSVFEVIADKDDFSDVKESLFVNTGSPVYSAAKPIPINPPMPGGLVFQVQVGAFRNKIPQDLFGEFAPVMGDKLDNGITRYRAGVFSKYRSAVEARDAIRAKGYNDAFVVAYVDGERLTGAQAQDILRQAIEADRKENPELAARVPLTGKPVPVKPAKDVGTGEVAQVPPKPTDYYNDPEAAKAIQVEATPGLFYTVQVGVYSRPVKLDKLYNLVELNSELTSSGYIRYTSGRYASVEAATSRKAEAISKGVSDAFVTAYYNGKRISLEAAEKLLQEKGPAVLSGQTAVKNTPKIEEAPKKSPEDVLNTDNDVKYVIVLGSYAGDIPQNVANVFLERPDLKVRRVTAPNGVSIYASPEFDTRKEAEEFLELSRRAGVHSAVMGEVVNGKIRSVSTK